MREPEYSKPSDSLAGHVLIPRIAAGVASYALMSLVTAAVDLPWSYVVQDVVNLPLAVAAAFLVDRFVKRSQEPPSLPREWQNRP
jgi:membrane protein implicated in regulation of membrane protease activity